MALLFVIPRKFLVIPRDRLAAPGGLALFQRTATVESTGGGGGLRRRAPRTTLGPLQAGWLARSAGSRWLAGSLALQAGWLARSLLRAFGLDFGLGFRLDLAFIH